MKKINKYAELKNRHQTEFNAFPLMFAFNDEQFVEGMKKLGLKPTDTDQILYVGACGYMRKSDEAAFDEMNARHRKEEREAMEADATGEGYIRDMFAYELANHEYGYTYELDQTLECLGLTEEQIEADPRLKRGLELALKRYHDED